MDCNHNVERAAIDAMTIKELSVPINTGHSPNAVSILGQRRGRWANIETAFV